MKAPALAGSNWTVREAVWPGFSVTGNVVPDIVKPVPDKVAELMVSGAVPAELNVRFCFAGVFKATLPNARLAELTVRVGAVGADDGWSSRAKVFVAPPALAVRVADWTEVTAEAVAVNPMLVAFAGTVTVGGMDTAALLLVRPTLKPPFGAAVLRVTVQASAPAPVRDPELQAMALSTGELPEPFFQPCP